MTKTVPGNGTTKHGGRKRLGQLLLERGWINGEQLIRAVQSQRAVGGRIGTCLLEMDAVTEDRLLDALAAQLGVPPIRIEQLRTIGSDVLRLVPTALAVRYRAVPFASSRSEVRVAALDVEDLARLDELAFCAGKRVQPHIANEARLFEALERYYSIECPQRYGHLLDRLNRARYLWRESAGDATPAAFEENPFGLPDIDWVRSDEAFGPLADPALSEASSSPPPDLESPSHAEPPPDLEPAPDLGSPSMPVPQQHDEIVPDAVLEADETVVAALVEEGVPPLAPPRSLAQVAADLALQEEAQGVAEILLAFLAGPFVRCGLMRAEHGHLRGWHAFGPGLDIASFAALILDPEALTARRAPEREPGGSDTPGPIRAGQVEVGRIDPAVAACWHGVASDDWIVAPIMLKSRMVSVILGHRDGRPAPERLLLQLSDLANKAALALELCILRRKLVGPGGNGHGDLTMNWNAD